MLLVSISPARAAAPATAPAQPSYFAIPLAGRLGYEVTVEALQKALNAAGQSGARYVVFLIDSSGGSVEELDRILILLARPGRDLPIAAVVKRADGPAAVLPYACRWVFVDGQGGTSSLTPAGESSLTEAQEAQFAQAARQRLQQACELGGRNVLPALAMVDPGAEYFGDGAGRVAQVRLEANWTPVVPPGQRLVVVPANAVASGYADGVCQSLDEVALKMGISDGWRSAGDEGRRIMQMAAERSASELRKAAYLRQHGAEIEALQKRIREERQRLARLEEGEGGESPSHSPAPALSAEAAAEKERLQKALESDLAALEKHEAQMR